LGTASYPYLFHGLSYLNRVMTFLGLLNMESEIDWLNYQILQIMKITKEGIEASIPFVLVAGHAIGALVQTRNIFGIAITNIIISSRSLGQNHAANSKRLRSGRVSPNCLKDIAISLTDSC
jgi:hypothetical protein